MYKSIFLKGLKLIPIIMGLFLLSFNVAYWNNCEKESSINNITGTSVSTTVILYAASIQLNFCKLHKHFIIYDGIASIWVDLKKILDPFIGIKINFVIVGIGIILVIWLIIFLLKKRKKPGH